MDEKRINETQKMSCWSAGLLITAGIVLIPFWLLFWFIRGKRLGWRVRSEWFPRGKYALFVTSDSPVWSEYVANNILPKIQDWAIVMNWSERSEWEWDSTLELKVFKHWAGVSRLFLNGRRKWSGREFCPVAIVFLSWWKPEVIRFWQAFKDAKHGNRALLEKQEAQLFASLQRKP